MQVHSRINIQLIALVNLIVILLVAVSCNSLPSSSVPPPSSTPLISTTSTDNFVRRSGTQLMLNGHPFRFSGTNMHWLGLDDSTNYPSQFRINDGLDAAKEMGATVIRSHDLGISTGCRNCIEPALGIFNSVALAHDDYVVQAAGKRGLRLVIPL